MNFENEIEFGCTDDSLLEVTHENFMGDLKKLNSKAIAITDHGNILAAFEFYQDAKNEGINAIIGMDAYIAPMNRQNFSKPIQRKDISFRLPLLAYSMLGYQTLIKLSSAAYFSRPYLSGFLSQPRIDKELLEANHEGLIGLSGYLEGEICYYILENNYEKALATTKYYANLFGQNNFYIEIQSDATEIQKIANTGLKKIALELDLPLVESKDIYHLAKINHHHYGRVISFSDKNESFINRFHLETDQQAISIPTFKTPDGLTEKEYLEMLAFEGLKTILGVESEKKNYGERLKKELFAINDGNFNAHFLFAWDLVQFANKNKIAVWPGHGAVVGCLVAYAIGLTEIDPIKHDLIFERFLNRSQNKPPHIGLIFCQERMPEVIDYAYSKYGEEQGLQVTTSSTVGAKNLIRGVGRILNIPFAEVETMIKQLHLLPGVSFKDTLEKETFFKAKYEENESVKLMFDIALMLESLKGTGWNTATNIVISKDPVLESVAIYKNGKGLPIRYELTLIEQEHNFIEIGIKGSQILTETQKSLEIIQNKFGEKVNLKELPMNDIKTYRELQNIKYFVDMNADEKSFNKLTKELKPGSLGSLEDLVALASLLRPSLSGLGMVANFINSKNGYFNGSNIYKILWEDMLNETYGNLLYQEQLMRMAKKFGNFSLEEADSLMDVLLFWSFNLKESIKYHDLFIEGAKKNRIQTCIAQSVYEFIEKEGRLTALKADFVAFATGIYRLAYLKTHYQI